MRRSIADKVKWLQGYAKSERQLDILNKDLVDAYVLEFSPSHTPMGIGADRCRELGRVLSECHKRGVAERAIVSLTYKERGFPNWVYGYLFKD